MYNRLELRDMLLGQYDFFTSPVVFNSAHSQKLDSILTSAHEYEHYRMAHNTTFGWAQIAASTLIKNLRMRPDLKDEAGRSEEVLSKLLDASWYCHEGAATLIEYSRSSILQLPFNISEMPDMYQEALAQAGGLLNFLSDESQVFSDILGTSLIEAALNTRILTKIQPADLTRPSSFGFLDDQRNRPDKRIAQIQDMVNNRKVGKPLEVLLQKSIRELVENKCKLSVSNVGMFDVFKNHIWNDVALTTSCYNVIQVATLSFLHRVDPETVFYDKAQVRVLNKAFWDSFNLFLVGLGIRPRKLSFDVEPEELFESPKLHFEVKNPRIVFDKGHQIYDVGEYDINSVLTGFKFIAIHIMANSTPLDLPLSGDGEVILHKESSLIQLIPIEIDKKLRKLSGIPNRYCYRKDFKSLWEEISARSNLFPTVSTTSYSFDVKKKELYLSSPTFDLPASMPFFVFVTDPTWEWVTANVEMWSHNKNVSFYVETSQPQVQLLVYEPEPLRYFLTIVDNRTLQSLGMLDRTLPNRLLQSAQKLSNSLSQPSLMDIAGFIYFEGIADTL